MFVGRIVQKWAFSGLQTPSAHECQKVVPTPPGGVPDLAGTQMWGRGQRAPLGLVGATGLAPCGSIAHFCPPTVFATPATPWPVAHLVSRFPQTPWTPWFPISFKPRRLVLPRIPYHCQIFGNFCVYMSLHMVNYLHIYIIYYTYMNTHSIYFYILYIPYIYSMHYINIVLCPLKREFLFSFCGGKGS